jgi:hypothetical protein
VKLDLLRSLRFTFGVREKICRIPEGLLCESETLRCSSFGVSPHPVLIL